MARIIRWVEAGVALGVLGVAVSPAAAQSGFVTPSLRPNFMPQAVNRPLQNTQNPNFGPLIVGGANGGNGPFNILGAQVSPPQNGLGNGSQSTTNVGALGGGIGSGLGALGGGVSGLSTLGGVSGGIGGIGGIGGVGGISGGGSLTGVSIPTAFASGQLPAYVGYLGSGLGAGGIGGAGGLGIAGGISGGLVGISGGIGGIGGIGGVGIAGGISGGVVGGVGGFSGIGGIGGVGGIGGIGGLAGIGGKGGGIGGVGGIGGFSGEAYGGRRYGL